VLKSGPVSGAAVEALEFLVGDAARADCQVADLGVAHLSGGQPDRLARGLERRMRVPRPQRIEHRRVGELDRIPRAGRRAAPAVEDHERYERESRAAASQIAVNDSTSSEAPPTRAPSTRPCPGTAAAIPGST